MYVGPPDLAGSLSQHSCVHEPDIATYPVFVTGLMRIIWL
jgi:hypothetical protein